MTKKIELENDLLPLLGGKNNVLDGIIGSVEHYDFSRSTESYEARVQAVTKIASICYQNPNALGSINLFNRLQAESAGLPSSSYEMCPVLIKDSGEAYKPSLTRILNQSCREDIHDYEDLDVLKYGENLLVDGENYLLSNLRALISDVGPDESLNYFNTSKKEQEIIKDNFKVFLFNVDLSTRAQMVRHRVSWQELSRRYVSGKRKEFEFYVSNKLKPIKSVKYEEFNTQELINQCIIHYNRAIAAGVKPEEARRILPQAMMTQLWGAFKPKQLKVFFDLRLHKTAQQEIRWVAEAMKELL